MELFTRSTLSYEDVHRTLAPGKHGMDDDAHDAVPRRAAPSLGRLPAAALVACCSLVASWALGHMLLVRPAQAALAQAQHLLLQAEREEMAAETAALRARRGPRQARTAKRYSKAAAPARLVRVRARATACSRGQRPAPWRGVLLDSLALMLAAAKAQQGIVVQRAWRA